MQVTRPVCPIHSNGGTGHDDNPPLFNSMPLVKCVQKVADKCECEGRKGRVEIYVWNADRERSVIAFLQLFEPVYVGTILPSFNLELGRTKTIHSVGGNPSFSVPSQTRRHKPKSTLYIKLQVKVLCK